MAINEPANPKVASLASQGLYDPASLTQTTYGRSAPQPWREFLTTARPRLWGHALYEQIDRALAMVRLEISRPRQLNETSGCGSLGDIAPHAA
jgi:hypothetical protein